MLPNASTEDLFDAIVDDEAALRPGVEDVCRSLGLEAADVERFPTGSQPVYAVGDTVLKFFPAVFAEEVPVEAGVLSAIHGKLPVPTPGLRDIVERDGWSVVVMDRLPGTPLDAVWPEVGFAAREAVAEEVGSVIAALHAVPPPSVEDWWPQDWTGFVAEQRLTAVERQRACGLGDVWLEQIPDYLARVDVTDGRRVLLHTEVMPANLLAVPDDRGGWRLSGLVDLEPAMRGAPEYEFVAVGVFLAEGNPRLLHRVLTAYGLDPSQLDGALARRLLAWTLLHVYGDLERYLQRLPSSPEPTLDALAVHWFGG